MKIKFNKIFIAYILVLSLFIFSNSNVFAQESEEIAPGVTRKEYNINNNDKNTYINVLTINLDNPYVDLKVVAGEGKYTKKATVSSMAKRVDATALVNGDFFNMLLQGSPEGPSIIDDKLQTSPVHYIGLYSLGISKDNKAYIDEIKFDGKITASNGKSFKIDGLNKSYYWYEPTNEYSHQDKLNLYTDFWASKSRGDKKNSEILINQDGIVEQISEKKNFDFPVPDGKFIIQADGSAYQFIKENCSIGSKVKLDYSITPNHDFKFLIGGHALLVDKGEVVKYTKDINVLEGTRARTAAGITEDGKTLYIVSAEGRTKRSAGLKLGELSNFMKSIGVYRALNLDGGGSTTMVAKSIGEFERTRYINPEKNAAERKVVNGIGIFNTAQSTGEVTGVKIKGPNTMVIGESAEFGIGGAWDKNLVPQPIENINYQLVGMNQTDGTWKDNWFLALTPGEINLVLTTDNGISTVKTINVKDVNYIKSIKSEVSKKIVTPNENINIVTKAILEDGREIVLSPKVLNYSISDFEGVFDENGNLLISSLNGNYIGNIYVRIGDKESKISIYDANVKSLIMKIGSKDYSMNGETLKLDQAPFIKDNRTFLPVRFVVEALGGLINYDEANKVVEIKYEDKEIKLPIDKNEIIINDIVKNIDTKAFLKGGRTFVPIRFIAEEMGMDISYNENTKEVNILSIPTNVVNDINQNENKSDNSDNLITEDNKVNN